jgi:hypothetical protein
VMGGNGRRVVICDPSIYDRTDAESHVNRSGCIKKGVGSAQGKVEGGDIVVKGVGVGVRVGIVEEFGVEVFVVITGGDWETGKFFLVVAVSSVMWGGTWYDGLKGWGRV